MRFSVARAVTEGGLPFRPFLEPILRTRPSKKMPDSHPRDPSLPPPASIAPPGDGEPRRVAVVVNGRAKNVTAEVISTLDRILEGSDLFVSRRIEDAREIAQTLVHRGYS